MNAKQTLVTLSACFFVANVAANDPAVSFEQLDTNNDGFISKIEASADKVLTSVFDKLDSDQDGSLSAEEFSEFGKSLIEKSLPAEPLY